MAVSSNQNLNRYVRTIHKKATTSFSCTECDYSTSRQDNLNKHPRKIHDNTAPVHNIPPKIAHKNTNIIEPNENEQFLRNIEKQELSDMLCVQSKFLGGEGVVDGEGVAVKGA